MKKSNLLIILLVLLAGLAAWRLTLPSRSRTNEQTSTRRLEIAATIHPLADIAQQVGGDLVDVKTILPPGASPHTFEPTPQQIRDTQSVRLIFAIGQGLDDWAKPIADNASQARIVTVDQGIQLRQLPLDQRDKDAPDQSVDPHYWLTAGNAEIIAQNIAKALESIDPGHRATYEANLAGYRTQLQALDAQIRNELKDLPRHELVTHHNAWGYFADAYGLKVVGTFEVSPGKEPTPQEIADLQTRVKQFDVKTIFSEPELSDEALKPFIQDLGLQTAVLDPEGGLQGMGYIAMMRYNADTIAKALKD